MYHLTGLCRFHKFYVLISLPKRWHFLTRMIGKRLSRLLVPSQSNQAILPFQQVVAARREARIKYGPLTVADFSTTDLPAWISALPIRLTV